MNDNIRICKICGKELRYKSYTSFHNASVRDKPCWKCSNTDQIGMNNSNYKHGFTHSKAFNTWANIKVRCFNEKSWAFKYYGGRGITLYEDWINNSKSFCEYVSSLDNYNTPGFTLDRINNDGNYEPGNLRYADKKIQRQNQRKSEYVQPRDKDTGRFLNKK